MRVKGQLLYSTYHWKRRHLSIDYDIVWNIIRAEFVLINQAFDGYMKENFSIRVQRIQSPSWYDFVWTMFPPLCYLQSPPADRSIHQSILSLLLVITSPINRARNPSRWVILKEWFIQATNRVDSSHDRRSIHSNYTEPSTLIKR